LVLKTVLTIAGSDCSGGAGIQADLKTMAAHGVYGMSAITSLTAQNTTGVYGISDVSPEFLGQQLDCIFTDIFPDAVKIGMVSDRALIEVIAEKLVQYAAHNIVVDTVMVSTSGSRLLKEDAIDELKDRLIPLADLITPNIPEAEVLSGIKIDTPESMVEAAKIISENIGASEPSILIKGGHELNTANDLLYTKSGIAWFEGERIDNPNTHGTGCTLSSAIACNLAMGKSLAASVRDSKTYISGALKAGLDLGKGSGPLNHMYGLDGKN
jgi:hydroxymethylpyrimidine/phosphomethylpyrimidine kinase